MLPTNDKSFDESFLFLDDHNLSFLMYIHKMNCCLLIMIMIVFHKNNFLKKPFKANIFNEFSI